ncbi:MAG: hypothetical protein QNJ57_08935 [Flavobacteriaceae bacterium]|nr:hypothetical protein [Flavobacteriaceae bacterium]
MKKVFNIISVLVIAVLIGCSSDDADMNSEARMQQIIAQAASGTWKITSYIDSGKDETSDYDGYVFTFKNDGSLVATKGTVTINGTWSVTRDSDSSDDDDNDIDFNISFTAPEIFQELTDDWDINSNTSSKIDLIDVSGGSGETDSLVFEKK